MAKILEILALLVGMAPLVFVLVKQFETPGFGAEKKAAVLKTIGDICDQLSLTPEVKTKIVSIAGVIVEVAVSFFILVGVFKHGNPTPNI